MSLKLNLFLVAFAPFLAACASDYVRQADRLAVTTGLKKQQIKTDTFLLTAYAKETDPTQPTNIYIEGDGMAWLSAHEPSMNPTPRKALGLVLAAADPSPNVIYIARPCQYTPLALDAKCSVTYWTDRRFSEEVISSVNQAIDALTALTPVRKINLVGYSGGAAVAVLVAARRRDVMTLRTVAGNLDHAEVNRLHDVSPMVGSLNAIDYAKKIGLLPQIHFSGAKDTVITPAIAQRYLAASSPTSCVQLRTIADATHDKGWVENWPVFLKIQPACSVY